MPWQLSQHHEWYDAKVLQIPNFGERGTRRVLFHPWHQVGKDFFFKKKRGGGEIPRLASLKINTIW